MQVYILEIEIMSMCAVDYTLNTTFYLILQMIIIAAVVDYNHYDTLLALNELVSS